MWPNSPAIPLRPRCTAPSRTTAPPMPVPSVTTRASRDAARRAVRALGAGRAVGVVVEHDRPCPSARSSRARTSSSRHGRCGANITRSPAASTKPGRGDARRRRSARRRRPRARPRSARPRPARRRPGGPGVVRRAVRSTSPGRRHGGREHLGAADVDADEERPSPLPAGQVGGADQAGPVAEPGLADLRDRAGSRGRPAGPANAARIGSSSRSSASLTPPPIDDDAGVEDLGQRRDALAEPAAELGQLLDGARVAVAAPPR